MGERENIQNMDGNLESLRRYEAELQSGEEQLEAAQEELYEELQELLEAFLDDVKLAAKHSEHDLQEDAMTYIKDNL